MTGTERDQGRARRAFGLYVHLPFCSSRCPYCGFAVVTGLDHLQERYTAAIAAEIHRRFAGEGPFSTVFFGGGTPGRMPPELIGRILDAARDSYGLADDAEITIEANPASADVAAFAGLRRAGCNRLSLGLQSLADTTLKLLGRAHSAADGERAYAAARDAGFGQVSLDLIFGAPGAPASDWETSLCGALALGPDHLSAYALTIEEDTPFHRRRERGELPAVSDAAAAAAFETGQQVLRRGGYEQYEVSNFARPGCRCRHNWDCWMGEEYIGVGLSAHSFLHGRRAWNTASIAEYMEAAEAGRSAEGGWEELGDEESARELAWLRLRTAAGLALDVDSLDRMRADRRMTELVRVGLAEMGDGTVRLTGAGLAVADAVAEVICNALGTRAQPGREGPTHG